MNKVILAGNLGADPETRATQGGNYVMNFRMATNGRVRKDDGSWEDKSDWHTCVMWGKRAESLARFLAAGTHLTVEGRLQTRSYEAKDGTTKYVTEVVVNEVTLGSKKNGAQGQRQDQGQGHPQDDDFGF